MLKDFLLRKIVRAKMKDVPREQRDKVLAVLESNPELFQQLSGEIQAKVASGQDQMAAVMAVMKDHEEELKKIIN